MEEMCEVCGDYADDCLCEETCVECLDSVTECCCEGGPYL
jgi:hypothetical protein